MASGICLIRVSVRALVANVLVFQKVQFNCNERGDTSPLPGILLAPVIIAVQSYLCFGQFVNKYFKKLYIKSERYNYLQRRFHDCKLNGFAIFHWLDNTMFSGKFTLQCQNFFSNTVNLLENILNSFLNQINNDIFYMQLYDSVLYVILLCYYIQNA